MIAHQNLIPNGDPLIDEVREARARMWRESGENLDALAEGLRQIDRVNAHRLVKVEQSESEAAAVPLDRRPGWVIP